MNNPCEDPESRLAAIVASSDDAMVSKDLDGVITSWNRAAEEMFGFSAAEAIGSHISIIVPHDLLAEQEFVLSQVRSGAGIRHFETRRRRKNGTFIDIDLTVSPIRNAEGVVVGASKVARDITEQKRLRQIADETSRMKDEFLAVFSHELRTPLNNVLGNAQLLRKDICAEHRERALDSLERNAQALARLVDDVLESSRIITGKLQLSFELFDVDRTVLEAIDTLQPTLDAKGASVMSSIETGLHVRGDRDRLLQVVWNVLSNAAKFTPRGGNVTVRAATHGGSIVIAVQDSGIGIDPKLLQRVFQRFWQADGSYTREHGGLGIGLALARHVVELHGGHISAASAGLGHGTTITMVLPCAEVAASVPIVSA